MKIQLTEKQELINELNDKKKTIQQAKVKYKKIISENEKDRYHILTIENSLKGNNVSVRAVISLYTPEVWEDFTGVDGAIVKRGLNGLIKTIDGGDVYVLWNPSVDNKSEVDTF